MTVTFFCPEHGRHFIYDTASGAVIPSSELEAYICDAVAPFDGEKPELPLACPADIRYELARFASTEVNAAYGRIKDYYSEGLIFGKSTVARMRTSGEYSADGALFRAALTEAGLAENELELI